MHQNICTVQNIPIYMDTILAPFPGSFVLLRKCFGRFLRINEEKAKKTCGKNGGTKEIGGRRNTAS